MALGALDIVIAADTAQLRKGMDEAVGMMKSSTQKMESFAKTAGAVITGAFALTQFQSSIKASLDLADSLGKMSQKIGVSVDALYSLQVAGKLADVDMQTLEKSLLKFNKGLGDAQLGTGSTTNALKNLGISLKDSAGHLKTSDQYLFEVADRFKAMPNGIEKSTLAMQLFGKSGADMIPLLNGGSEALKEYSGIMDSNTAAAAEKFNDSLTTVGIAVDAVWMQMTSSLSPTLSAIADDFVNVAKEGKDTGKTLGDDLAQGMKVAINLGYIVAGSFDMAGHALGNLGAAVAMFAEGDFDGASFAWDRIAKDAALDQKRWDDRIKKIMSANEETEKASNTERDNSASALEDFEANQKKKEEAAKKAAAALKKLSDDISKAKLDAMRDNADREADIALSVYRAELDAAQFNIDQISQMYIDSFNAREQAEIDSFQRIADSALSIFNSTQSEKDRINAENMSIWEDAGQFFDDTQMQSFFQKWQESIDGVKGGYNDISDAIGDYGKTSKDWTAGLTGQAKSVANVGNALADIFDDQKKYDKLRKDVNKSSLTDEEKKIKLLELEGKHTNAQIWAYSNLAGAAAGFFEEGSKGAERMQQVSATLGIVQGIQAIISAWGSAPFPLNMPAVAVTTAAVVPLVAQLGGSLGGGGGGGSAPSENFDLNRDAIEANYQPMTDRLDRQIDLLEAIERNGSASQLGVKLASTEFARDTKLWVEDVLEKARQGLVNSAMTEEQASAIAQDQKSRMGFNVWDVSGGAIGYDRESLREGSNLIKLLIDYTKNSGYDYTGTLYQQAGLDKGYDWSNLQSFVDSEMLKDISEYQNLVSDWALAVVESMNDLKDAAGDFQEYYDGITGSMYYETSRLKEAYRDVDKLRGENSFADYLRNSIGDIDALQSFFDEQTFNLLMSNDTADIEAQIVKIEELSAITGETFDGGAREALNYLESIQLVSEAMETSRNNISTWADSFKSQAQLGAELAARSGFTLAGSMTELQSVFAKLATDTEGLTDIELDALKANKAIIEAKNKEELDYLTRTRDSLVALKEFADNLYYANKSAVISSGASKKYLDNSIVAYQNAIATNNNPSKALSDIRAYSADYISAMKQTSQTDADYNFAVASLASKLKSIGGNEATINTLDSSIHSLDANIEMSMSEQLSALDGIKIATDAQTQLIVDTLTSSGIKLAEGWEPTATFEEYTKVIGMYVEKGILSDQATVDGIDYWVGEMNKFSADAISTMIDSITAEQASLSAVSEAVNQVALSSTAGLAGISGSVAGLSDTTLEVIGGVSGAVSSLSDTTLSGLDALSGSVSALGEVNTAVSADVGSALSLVSGSIYDTASGTVSAISSSATSTESAITTLTTTSSSGTQTLASLLAGMATSGHTSDLFASLNAVTNAMGSGLEQRIAEQSGSIDTMNGDIGSAFDELIRSISGDSAGIARSIVEAIGLSTESIVTSMLSANNVLYPDERLTIDAIVTQTSEITTAINLQTSILSEAIRPNSDATIGDYITSLYTNGLGRSPDSAGYDYWMKEITSGKLAISDLLPTFSYAAQANGSTFEASNIKVAPNSGTSTALITEIKALRNQVGELNSKLESIEYNTARTATNTSTTRVAI